MSFESTGLSQRSQHTLYDFADVKYIEKANLWTESRIVVTRSGQGGNGEFQFIMNK